MRKLLVLLIGVSLLTLAGFGVGAFAAPGGQLPESWHVHDGVAGQGPQHQPIAFFPYILDLSAADYAQDPALCPDATDKAFLPQGRQDDQPLRAGVCMTSSAIIHLRSVAQGTPMPNGWAQVPTSVPGGLSVIGGVAYVTYFRVTER